MARQKNDGRGRMGGRAKGTPNKPKAPIQEWLDDTLRKHRTRIEQEMANVSPDNFALVYAALALAASIRSNSNALLHAAEAREQADKTPHL